MRGHVKKRSTWEFVVELGIQPLQRCPTCRKRYWLERARLKACPKCAGELEDKLERRQEFHTGYKTKREAQDELARVITALSSGNHIPPSKVLLGEFLKNEWLPAIEATIRPTTYLSYKGHVERHIDPALGRLPLQQLTGAHINAFYSRLRSENGDSEKKKLSPATVRRIHATLHRAMKDAVRWNKIQRNPADAADPPRASECGDGKMKIWSIKELRQFLTQQRHDRLYPLWLLLATTGMRRGEALGLRWGDVDLEAKTVSIRQTRVVTGYEAMVSEPKTRRGRRLIALDPATVAALKENRRRQKEERLSWGALWNDAGMVFTREDGKPYHPERITKLFLQAGKTAGLPRIRLHDLRHTYASLALAVGIHPKVVSERLGHANISITLDTYSHAIPALSEEAADRVAALLTSESS